MVEALQTFVAPVLLLAGCFFCFAGGVGVMRFPDFFTRMHAAGVSDTLGAGLIIVALMLFSMDLNEVIKLGLILAFILITSPTSSHALAKAAVHAGVLPIVEPEVALDKEARNSDGGDSSNSS
ncbi:MAG: multicomponent Na+:H+ antiporter subunit G [Candidatus Azotimanducaceae bacterium]|jgi:multicomponent Na+:H+ antiporter subunit G